MELQKLYVDSIVQLASKFKPVSKIHIREIDKCFINKHENLALPMAYMEPYISDFCGKSIYGASVGLTDFIFFENSQWTDIQLSMKYSANLKSKNLVEFQVKFTDAKGKSGSLKYNNRQTRLFDTEVPVNFHKHHFDNTLFGHKNPKSLINSLVDISLVDLKSFTVYDVNDSERVLIVTRSGSEVDSISDGFKANQIIIGDLDIDQFNPDLARILSSLILINGELTNNKDFVFDIFGQKDAHNIDGYLAYLASVIYQFLYEKISSTRQIVIKDFELEISIKPQIETIEKCDNNYNHLIENGAIVPIAPLHILRYLGNYDHKLWREFVFCSALVGMNLNPIIQTVTPISTDNAKRNMALVALFRKRLNSEFYDDLDDLIFSEGFNYAIDYSDFLKEMLIRILIDSDTPSYFRLMSEGTWKGSSGSSMVVTAPSRQNVFSKYTVDDIYGEIMEFNENMALVGVKMTGIRRSARMVDKLPDIFNSIVEHEQ
jgi:hypothetical protein